MSTEDYRNLIGGLPFMLDCPESLKQQAISVLIELARPTQVAEGTCLFGEGDQSEEAGYILLSGSIRIDKSYGPSSQSSAPAMLGEVKQFNPKSERTATVTALDDLEVLQFHWPTVNDALHTRLDEHENKVWRQQVLDYAWQHLLN